jgi:hypothetical protein
MGHARTEPRKMGAAVACPLYRGGTQQPGNPATVRGFVFVLIISAWLLSGSLAGAQAAAQNTPAAPPLPTAATPPSPGAPSAGSQQPVPGSPASGSPGAGPAASGSPASGPIDLQSGARPIAIVPLDVNLPGAAKEVTGGLSVFNGRAFIVANGAITSGSSTTQVTLPYRGTLRVCASTTVKLSSDASVPAGEIPGLLMAIEQGAVEASFATGRNSDILITPDFRILIGGPGAAEVKVRLGQHGDTCVDNAGTDAPYVLVTSVFDGGAYRVQAGQRVMFQNGKINEVVDQEKEPCGCPPQTSKPNEFPLAQSEGLAPTPSPPSSPPSVPSSEPTKTPGALVYNGADKPASKTEAAPAEAPAPVATPAATAPMATAPEKKPGVFKRIGHFFRKIFSAD